MGVRPFTSESYARGERPALWRDVLASAGLAPISPLADYDGFASASQRIGCEVTLTRLAAGAQDFAATAAEGPPLAFLAGENCLLKPEHGADLPLAQGVSFEL